MPIKFPRSAEGRNSFSSGSIKKDLLLKSNRIVQRYLESHKSFSIKNERNKATKLMQRRPHSQAKFPMEPSSSSMRSN